MQRDRENTAARGFAWTLAACIAAAGCTDVERGQTPTVVGPEMPALQVEGWVNGSLTADDLKGKVVVIDAFATWCVPCRKATPKLIALHERYSKQGVVFAAVSPEESDSIPKLDAFVAEYRVPWPIAYGGMPTLDALGVEYFPSLYLYGVDGRQMWNDSMGGSLEDALDQAVAQGAKAPKETDSAP